MLNQLKSRVPVYLSKVCVLLAAFTFRPAIDSGDLFSQTQPREVRIGRVSKLPAQEVHKEAAPFLRYLEEKIPGSHFRAVPLSSDAEAIKTAIRGDVDFLYVTPSVFVQLEVQSGAMVIATAKRLHGPGVVLKYAGGVILCRYDKVEINHLADLRGKRVMGLNPLALGGWISALREFDDEGIDPKRDFHALRFGTNPEMVANAVLKGDVDAGVLSISEFPQLCAGGKFTAGQFRVLPPRRPNLELQGLPVAASTRLYPGTAFVKLPHVGDDLAEKVAIALFEMPENSRVSQSMLISGWTLPANYQPVHECLRQLRLAPYEHFGQVTLWGAVGQHWQLVTSLLLILLGALTMAMVAALRLNRKLRRSQAELHTELEQLNQAERALTYQARLLGQTRDAVVATDADFRVTFWNEAAEKLYGITTSEALGKRMENIVSWSSDSPPREQMRTRLSDHGEWSGEISFRNRSGALVFAELVISQIKGPDGNRVGFVGGVRDVTERRRLEEQLLQSQKMQAVGLLAGGVAHDFNNLLTVINGYTQLALDDPADECTAENLAEVLKAGTRASELTQQLLAFGRKQVLQPQILRLNDLVSEAERLLRRLIGEDIELVIDLDPAAGNVKADIGQMQQVILNLAVNARDALPDGGRVTLKTAAAGGNSEMLAGHAEITPGRYVLLMVEDDGVGMDEATKKRIFEPFFTTKEVGKGTGLGLSTVYGIVQQSGGHIWVQTETGKGAKFTVCFPEVDPASEQVPTPGTASFPQGRGNLLIVEDQQEVRDLACRILKSLGYHISNAANGAAALSLSEESEESIDLLLTDVIMPGITGPELATRLKSRYPEMKVLFMSGYADRASAQRAAIGSDAAYLQKPFLPNTLAQKVSEILGPARPAESAS